MITTTNKTTYIVELTTSEIKLIMQLLHLAVGDKDTLAVDAAQRGISSLVEQADCAFKESAKHQVWIGTLPGYIQGNQVLVKRSEGVHYKPYADVELP